MINLLRCADLDELAAAHDADPVAHHHRFLERVGDVHEGLAGLAVYVLQFLFERLAKLVVDSRQRFVEEQDFRVVSESASQARRAGARRRSSAARSCRNSPAASAAASSVRAPALFAWPDRHRESSSENSMFCPTVRCGNSASDWKTMHVGRRFAGRSFTRSPRMRMSPLVGISSPASMRSRVVFPQPDGPTMVKNSPSAILMSTPSTADRVPKSFRTPFSASSVCRAAFDVSRMIGKTVSPRSSLRPANPRRLP